MTTDKIRDLCRKLAAVVLLSLALALFDTSFPSVILRYGAFTLCIILSGISIKSSELVPTAKYTALCTALTLWLAVILSYIMPSEKNVEIGIVSALLSVFAVPIFEELFFRASLSSLPLYPLTSALIFGLFHPGGFISAALIGAVLALFYTSSKCITVPIICHMANNALAVISTFRDIRLPILIASSAVIIIINRSKK